MSKIAERLTPIFSAISATGTRSTCRTVRSSALVGFFSLPACRKGRNSKSSFLRANLRSRSRITHPQL
jgi:hypothetical protein